ncbi:probable aspartyl aminopeptidase [Selaginella moellendorffii]|uniref:probable aspartyl aminopeptidase n=1 Tax=Selaginella moellendorffii TaxID=88036 RepID=UPI000D1C4E47|nr:probable aspartyl aminopeptidase [Selaginella moellendorffii]|eukprot:XP_024521749.1 probable aspartyl aminopeptidase [Selaginella moellendorffii]
MEMKAAILGAQETASDLISFLNAAPTPFHAVAEAKRRLEAAGFTQLSERDSWALLPGGTYYFTRNFSTIVAFAIGKRFYPGCGFAIVGAHTDSPCPKLKPRSKIVKGGFLELGVQTYGSGLWHTWFDRDLTVAGRVMVRRGNGFSHELVHVKEPILRIPTLAIHLDKTVSEGFKINTQTQLVPVLASCIKDELSKSLPDENGALVAEDANSKAEAHHHSLLLKILSSELGCESDDICDFELQVCDTQPSSIGGALKEFVFSGRLDNLCMSFCSLKALIDSTSEASLENETVVRMVALFDHEEVGSNSAQGAGSPVMLDALKRITISMGEESSQNVEKAIQQSLLVSADMAHCLHPNYMDKHEENHQPKMHKGLVVKYNANQRYATNAVTSFIFKEIARRQDLPTQDFVVRNDMACGSTIGPILASGVGIRTVDVGAPQLSMHSIREMCGVDDVGYSYRHFKLFFEDFSALDQHVNVD